MIQAFARTRSATTYPERWSPLTDNSGNGLNLRPLASIKPIIEADERDVVVIKPLVESHRAQELLSFFGYSRALWVFRAYPDVVASCLAMWPAISKETHLRPMLKPDHGSVMGHRGAYPSEVISFVEQVYHMDPSQEEVMTTFWIARNEIYLTALSGNERARLVRYEKLVKDYNYASSVFSHFDVTLKQETWERSFNAKSIRKGGRITRLRRVVREKANDVYARLRSADDSEWLHRTSRPTP